MNYVAVDINEHTDPDVMNLVINMDLRAIDRVECDLVGLGDSIMNGIIASGLTYCKAGFNTITGCPEFIFGVAATDHPAIGSPWMLATEEFKITKDWLKMCKNEIYPEMDKTFPILQNFVHKENKESIAWLRWLGFSFYDVPVTFKDDQTEPVPMYLFTKLGGTPLYV